MANSKVKKCEEEIAEEVRTRNQLELEKLLRQDQSVNSSSHAANGEPDRIYDENNKAGSRVRE